MKTRNVGRHFYGLGVRAILLGALILTVDVAYGQDAMTLNIDSCYAMARRNYPLIKQYDLIANSKEFTISNANKSYLPQVSVTAIGGYISGLPTAPGTETNNFKFIGIGQISQAIYDGGASKSQKKIAEATAEIDQASLEVSLYELRDRVNQIYFGILLLDEQKKQLDTLRVNLNRTVGNVKLYMKNGLAYQSDVDEAQAELLKVDQNMISLKFARKGFVDMLSNLIARQLSEDVKLVTPVLMESAATQGSVTRPELNLFASQQHLIELQTGLNKVYNMPKIGLLGFATIIEPGASLGPSSITNVFVGGISLSWNTGNLYKSSNNNQLDKIQIAKISNRQEVFNFNNNLQLRQTTSEIDKDRAIISKDMEIVSLKEKITQSYQLKYKNGLATMNDLINSFSKQSEARNNQSLHQIQLLLALYNYKTISGN